MSSTNTITHCVAATPFPESGLAARRAFERGGNAFDAAAAATLTLCVVSPGAVGVAGYGGSMVAFASGKGIVALDYDSRAPLAYRDDLFFGKHENLAKRGYLSTSVPGVLAGVAHVIKHYGKLTFRDAVQQAIEVAERGHTMDDRHHGLLQEWNQWTDPTSRKALFPTGEIPQTGATWKQPDFARLLRRLADEGPDAFYHGDIPRQIVRQIHDHGGILSEEDFASFKPIEVQPETASYRAVQFYTPPAPSGGLTTLQILKALEHFDVKKMEPWSAQFMHVLAEVTKACWRDRDRYFGDPDAVKIPRETLLSNEHIASIAGSVGDRAREYPPPGLPKESGHTVNVLTADTEGNVVSMTSTQGEMLGSGVAIDGFGMLIGHGMSRFTYQHGHPNAPAPGKRMFHNMSPLVGLRDGKPHVVIGMPGGPKIVNVSAQIAVNLLDFGRSPTDAIKHPRLHTQGSEPITVSPDLPERTVAELEKRGHRIVKLAAMGGPANAMTIDAAGSVSAANEYGTKGMVEV
jgi:gamma-glutamyltranspeptidase/glutathione hydrolase